MPKIADEINVKVILVTEDEYKRLQKDSDFLQCLYAMGLDNWEGYGEARRLQKEQPLPESE